jgi:cytosine/adenosine deaminase-related metal-dependent hydrolase
VHRVHPILVGPDRTGRTVAVTGGRVAASPGPGARILECVGADIVPGAVCAHTHLYSGLVPYGMPAPVPPPGSFLEILARVWWRLDRALDEASLRASARDAVARALLAGTTTLVDHHESPRIIEGSTQVLAEACQELGIRAILCYGATERNFGLDEARRGLAECRRIQPTSTIRGLVGLHASFTLSDEALREAGRLAHDLGTVVHVHVAEDLSDVADARARGAPGPLERLLALDALPRGSILAHGVHLSPEQVALANAGGMWLVQNPRSNEGNRVGYPRALRHGTRVATGGRPTWRSRRARSFAWPPPRGTIVRAAGWPPATRSWRSDSARHRRRWPRAPWATSSCASEDGCATSSWTAGSW